MENEGRAKIDSSRQDVWSQDLPLDLNSLYLPNSKKQSMNDPYAEFQKSLPSSSERNKRKSLKTSNNGVKLGYSKSCKIPTLLSDKSGLNKRKTKRTVSAPDTLQVPMYGMEKFSFERPISEFTNTSLCDNCKKEKCFDDNLHLGLKLPPIRITSTQSYKKQEVNNEKNTTSTAGIDFRLPYVKDQTFYR